MVDTIKELIEKAILDAQLELYEIEFLKEGNDWFLRVYLDKVGGIDLNDIVDATNIISNILDEKDPIEQEYILEVSSPGAERPINSPDKIKNALDEYIRVELINPKDGIDSIEGYLRNFDNDVLSIEYKEKTKTKKIDIDYSNVKNARLAVKF